MLVTLSHAAGFATLLAASAHDLRRGEVPDYISLIGIALGVLLHAGASLQTGSIQPILWSLGIGTGFFVMGWTAYLLGGWGGADALALAVLGFTAPYGVSGITSGYSIDLIVNLLIAGLLVTLVWSVVLAARKPEKVLSQTYENLRNDRARLVLELMGSLMFAFIAQKAGMQGFLYAVFFVSMVLLIRFMRAIESEVFEVEKDIEEVQPGEIVDTEALDGRIRGIEEDELEELKEGDVESVKVKSGIRFVPVFPVALLLTDFTSLGISFIVNIFAFGI